MLSRLFKFIVLGLFIAPMVIANPTPQADNLASTEEVAREQAFANLTTMLIGCELDNKCMLEDFIALWEDYFWNSYFSHLLNNSSPVIGNIVQLWQQQVTSNREFPNDLLIENNLTLKDLLV